MSLELICTGLDNKLKRKSYPTFEYFSGQAGDQNYFSFRFQKRAILETGIS